MFRHIINKHMKYTKKHSNFRKSLLVKIPLKWQAQQVVKNARLSWLYYDLKKNAMMRQHCSCIQSETQLSKCLCMWEWYELDIDIDEYHKLIDRRPVTNNKWHWVHSVLHAYKPIGIK